MSLTFWISFCSHGSSHRTSRIVRPGSTHSSVRGTSLNPNSAILSRRSTFILDRSIKGSSVKELDPFVGTKIVHCVAGGWTASGCGAFAVRPSATGSVVCRRQIPVKS